MKLSCSEDNYHWYETIIIYNVWVLLSYVHNVCIIHHIKYDIC